MASQNMRTMFCSDCKYLYYNKLFCPKCDKGNSFDEEDICIICDIHKEVHNLNVCMTISGFIGIKQKMNRDFIKILKKMNDALEILIH